MMLERALNGVEKVVTLKNGESRIMREYNDRVALALLRQHRESVRAFEQAIDDDEYQAACERIMEKLGRLRDRDAGGEEPPIEPKSARRRQSQTGRALRKPRARR
jgi:hypothetical protein